MPRHYNQNPNETAAIYEMASKWTDCLIEEGSLLWPDQKVWSAENLKAFKRCFIDLPDESADTFKSIFERQLSTETSIITMLACEILYVYLLFPSVANISGSAKVDLITDVASWKKLSINHPNLDVLLNTKGIGRTGTAYNTRRAFELGYLAELALAIVEKPVIERREILSSSEKFRKLSDDLQGKSNFQLRHIILHMLFPDEFEPISSTNNRNRIYKIFKKEMPELDLPDDIDDALHVIRESFEQKYPGKLISFYREPLKSYWSTENGLLPEGLTDKVINWVRNIRTSISGDKRFYHKAMVILALLVRLDEEEDHDNRFTYEELWTTFKELVEKRGGTVKEVQFSQPYVRLKNDISPLAVWKAHLEDPDYKDEKSEQPAYVRQALPYIKINDDVWPVFSSAKGREAIRQELKKKWDVEEVSVENGSQDVSATQYNTILYGPPGTGKTYSVVDMALEIIDKNAYAPIIRNPGKRPEAMLQFKELIDNGRIAFCTFHQSYGYEEFVEGLRSDNNGGFEPQDGIFKVICEAARASTTTNISSYNFDEDKISFYKMSLGNSQDSEEDYIYEFCIENNVVTLGWGEDVDYSDCNDRDAVKKKFEARYPEDDYPFNITAIDRFKNVMKTGDIILVSHGIMNLKAIARVTGEYYYDENTDIHFNHFRKVEWLYIYQDAMVPVTQILYEKKFSMMSIYRVAKNDLNLDSLRGFLSDTGASDKNFVLIIDEINRGNISKIFGELITLIEADKRIGAENEIKVMLPYSKQKFGVPKNLYIIGTMNTADRSIALLDTALRRRFCFKELVADYSLLSTDVDGVNVKLLLKTLNDRIEYLFDRDHIIGHAFFISQTSVSRLIEIMTNKVVPLLQEYFYEDWEKIELVLGGAGSPGDNSYFISKTTLDVTRIFHKRVNYEQPTKLRYSVVDNPSIKALTRIYGQIDDE